MNTERTQSPPIHIARFHPAKDPDFISRNGMRKREIIAWHNEQHPYVRLQFFFPFSHLDHPFPLIPQFVMKLLPQGTRNISWQELAETFDFFGTSLQSHPADDYTEFSIYCLIRFLPDILEVLSDVFQNANFQEEPLERLREKEKQQFQTIMEKVSVLSQRHLQTLYFSGTPLAKLTELADFNLFERHDLEKYFWSYYPQGPDRICICGGTEKHLQMVIDFAEKVWKEEPLSNSPEYSFNPLTGLHYVHKENALQSSIRLRKPIPYYFHPDYPYVYMLNELLGGYFGSRLMQNIREEKGYTYGIGSSILKTKNHLSISIHTEAGTNVTKATLNEILEEIRRLSAGEYPQEELMNLAKYKAGNLLERTNGLFENADSWLSDHRKGIHKELRRKLYDIFFQAKPQELLRVAARWFVPDEFTIVVAGDTTRIQ